MSREFHPSRNATLKPPAVAAERTVAHHPPVANAPRAIKIKKIIFAGAIFAFLFGAMISTPSRANAGEIAIGISLHVGPPPIPVYVQPPCPGDGYMWTPGYWAFDPDEGYYWVPGTWVTVPQPGFYWTPGYWGWGGDVFVWHAGYWGPHVGFYGGINYGFGYTGVGFVGGEWRGGAFFYNRSVTNITEVHVTNVYYHNVPNSFAANRVSYNGGQGGLSARPTQGEMLAERDHHLGATNVQQRHQEAAQHDRSQFAATNHGLPGVAATRNAGELHGAGAVGSTHVGQAFNRGNQPVGNPESKPGFSGGRHNLPAAGVHQPAGPQANPGVNHETNAEHSGGFSGYHNPNAGQVHQPTGNVYTPRESTPHESVTPHGSTPPTERGSEGGQFRPPEPQSHAPTPENRSYPEHGGGSASQPSHQPATHSAPPQHNPPSGGGGGRENKEHH